MMNETNSPKKPSTELEFIDVESGQSGASSVPISAKSESAGVKVALSSNDAAAAKKITDDGLLTVMRKTVTNAKHPVAAFFHIFFKSLALAVYLFGGIFMLSYVFIFVLCILLLAFDFWTVKNVTGRLLVGLRWWNRINEDGTNEWIFESQEDMTAIDPLDSRVFWYGLYGAPIMWTLLLIVAVLKFNIQWALIVAVALMLSSANIIGYTKCKKDAKQKMQSLMAQGAMGLGALSGVSGSSLLSTIGGLAMGGGSTKPQRQPESVTV